MSPNVFGDLTFQFQFGSYGSGNGQFNGPSGVATDSQGDMYVADQNNDRVEEFTSTGAFVRAFGSAGMGNGQLNAARALAIDPYGNVLSPMGL